MITDDPEADVALDLSLALKFDAVYEGQLPPIILDVSIHRTKPTPVRWAIVLSGDAALPYSPEDPAGNALPQGGKRGFDNVWVQGDTTSAFYFRNAGAGRPGEVEERVGNAGGSILAGTSPSLPTVNLHVVGPSQKPLLFDIGPQQYTNFPVLGVPGDGTAEDGVAFLGSARSKPVSIRIGDGGRELIAADESDFLESSVWYYPTAYDLIARLTDQEPWDRLSQVEPPVLAPLNWSWKAVGRLFVRATVEQPDWSAAAQRSQFLGGVLAGIGGGFLVWAAELAFAWWTHRTRRNAAA